MAGFLHLVRALRYGAELRQAEVWKNRATALAAVTGLLSALVGLAVTRGWMQEIDPQTIMEVASALVTLVSAVLAYLQVATSARVGVGKTAAQAVPPVIEAPAPQPFLVPEPPPERVAEEDADAIPAVRAARLHALEAAFGDPDPYRDATRHPEPGSVPPPSPRQRRDGTDLDTNPFIFS
jgi:hypothetical protein